jgi:glycoprotein-N-acetylgalactosamine 3-beta-galactosyltransferase
MDFDRQYLGNQGLKDYILFALGILIGIFCAHLLVIKFFSSEIEKPEFANLTQEVENEKYEHVLADQLFNEVKILCWVFTHTGNKHKVHAVRKLWGSKCNKLLFMTNEDVPDEDDVIKLPVADGRWWLWRKTMMTMKYVYNNYINEYDWFMRADDDK